MKKMAIVTLTPEVLQNLLNLPVGVSLIEARIPFTTPGVMEIKVEGAGRATLEGSSICYTRTATFERKSDGTLYVDWGFPDG